MHSFVKDGAINGAALWKFGMLKRIAPPALRRYLHAQYHEYVFQRALHELARKPEESLVSANSVIKDLVRGWNNEGWSALEEYLVACLHSAFASDGPILECGSGLTTIAMGLIANSTGQQIWSLEHNPEWGARVMRYLTKHRIDSVRLVINPLKDFHGFSWYDAPLDSMPQFALVICDGPPADTAGGRYGLLPVMKSKLRPGATILLDDAMREQEKEIAKQWASELGTSYEILGSEKPYIRLVVPDVANVRVI